MFGHFGGSFWKVFGRKNSQKLRFEKLEKTIKFQNYKERLRQIYNKLQKTTRTRQQTQTTTKALQTDTNNCKTNRLQTIRTQKQTQPTTKTLHNALTKLQEHKTQTHTTT